MRLSRPRQARNLIWASAGTHARRGSAILGANEIYNVTYDGE